MFVSENAIAPLSLVPVTATLTDVPVGYLPRVEKKAAVMAKRLAKLGAAAPTITVGARKVYDDRDEFGHVFHWEGYESITVTGWEARIAGWTPVASLDHTLTDDEAFVSKFPGAIESGTVVPDQFRFRGPVCDHCNVKIATRKTTVLFHHEDGRWAQVGTSCILEYIGIDPKTLLWLASSMTSLDDEELRSYRPVWVWSPAEILAAAAESTRLHGFVPTVADFGVSTRDEALDYWEDRKNRGRFVDFDIDAGRVAAAEIMAWVANSTETGEFILSAKLACRAEIATARTYGLLAALPHVFAKSKAAAADKAVAATRPSEYLGKPGDKVKIVGTVTTAMTVDTAYGRSRRVTVKTDDGDVVTTFGSGASLFNTATGDRVAVSGKIKDLEDSDRYGKQTVLTMVKISDEGEPEFARKVWKLHNDECLYGTGPADCPICAWKATTA